MDIRSYRLVFWENLPVTFKTTQSGKIVEHGNDPLLQMSATSGADGDGFLLDAPFEFFHL